MMKKIIRYFPSLLIVTLLFFACNDEQTTQSVETTPVISSGNPTLDALNQKISSEPKNPKVYYERASFYYEEEAYDEAIQDMAKAMSFDSTNADYHHFLADVYLDYYKSRPALLTMERVVKLYPERIPSLLKLSEFYLILKRNDDSFKILDRILKINPRNAEAYVMMGMNFEMMGGEENMARAINSFQTAVENDPSLADIWLKLGQLWAKKKHKIADKYFDNAIRLDSTYIPAIYGKAEYLHMNDQLDEALILLEKANKIDPQYSEAFFRAGIIYLEKNEIEKARNQFDICVKVEPSNALAYYYKGVTFEMSGDNEKAKTNYQRALKISPNYKKAQAALKNLN